MRIVHRRSVRPLRAVVVAAALAAVATHVGRGQPQEPHVTYLQLVDGYWQVFLVQADGQSARQLTTSPVHKIAPSWCPEPQLLHFATEHGDSVLYDLHDDTEAVLAPGSPLASLCKKDGASPVWVQEVRRPDWLPADKILASVRSSAPDLYPKFEYDVFDLAPILSLGRVPRSARNVLSESGRLYFISDEGGDPQIWFAEEGAGPPVVLTQVDGSVRNPALSPGGEWLVFEADFEGSSQLYRIAADGGPVVRLTDGTSPARGAVVSWPESEPQS